MSGAGKTSLINAISGLTRPQSGRIVLNDRVLNDVENKVYLSPDKRRIGHAFRHAVTQVAAHAVVREQARVLENIA
ncbi:ATP-binding cassette domain-containing protein, partial [Listeria monocytogenes]|uniref:ATP-binding cassette domain-containing protein n=1 Tax=Listeria monocytogenes TaxID=1639 RepID=UPI003D7DF585